MPEQHPLALTEGKVIRGGLNDVREPSPRPRPPGGSGGNAVQWKGTKAGLIGLRITLVKNYETYFIDDVEWKTTLEQLSAEDLEAVRSAVGEVLKEKLAIIEPDSGSVVR